MPGSLVSNWSWGRPVIEALNSLGLDAATIGDRDYDWPVDTLQARIRESRFAWLSANTADRRNGRTPPWVDDWTVIDRNGLRVAVIGHTTTSAPAMSRVSATGGLQFQAGAAAVTRVLPTVRATNPDVVIVLAHEGGTCDSVCRGEVFDLARRLPAGSVDLIAAGHTHVPFATVVNGIAVVNAGAFGTRLAVADVWRRADGRREVRTRLHTVWADSIREDPALADLVQRQRQQADRVAARQVADLKFPLSRQAGEFPLGQLIADGLRVAARSDVAIAANAAIEADLPAGRVTWGQVYQVQPAGHQVVKLSIRGDSLLRALEAVVGGPAGRVIQANVSGIEIRFDARRRVGQRVTRARLPDDRDVKRNETYTLAVTDALAAGDAGFTMLRGARAEPTGVSDVDALVSWLQRLPSPVEIRETTRIHAER
jgi:5'-nucleotidase